MTIYTAYKLVENGTTLELPTALNRVNATDVLYYIDGTVTANVEITTLSTDNEGYTTATTAPSGQAGIVWDTPKESGITVGTWSSDITSRSFVDNANKHSFLITQQVVCHEGINGFYALDVEERRASGEYYWTATAMSSNITTVINGVEIPAGQRISGKTVPFPKDNDYTLFKEWITAGIIEFKEPFKNSLRVTAFKNGGTADPLVTANDSSRATARFKGCAYATGVYCLNREEPQFSGSQAPATQFYVEGMKVRIPISESLLQGAKEYTTNPAAILLDYLMSTKYGRGIPLEMIDLPSFYRGYQICNQTKVEKVTLEGAYWRAKNTTREVKLYECNLVLDTSKPIRDNIVSILATMNDASLIWSEGKYKLSVAYPNIWAVTGELSRLDMSKTVGYV